MTSLLLTRPPSLREGWHIGTCVWVIDMGHQRAREWGRLVHKVRLSWELPLDRTLAGNPRSLSMSYTLSLYPDSRLRRMLEGWMGHSMGDPEEFDLACLLGRPALLRVQSRHIDRRVFSEVSDVRPMPAYARPPKPERTPRLFVFPNPLPLDPGDILFPAWLPSSVAEVLRRSSECTGRYSVRGGAKT